MSACGCHGPLPGSLSAALPAYLTLRFERGVQPEVTVGAQQPRDRAKPQPLLSLRG
jgi:hypothetical protein